MKLNYATMTEKATIYEARLWRKWANRDDTIEAYDNKDEALLRIPILQGQAFSGDTITVKECLGWDIKTLYREKIE